MGAAACPALALDVGDLDLATGSAISRHGKHGRVQTVYFPAAVAKLLRRYLKDAGIRNGPVFRSSRGSRLSPRQAQYRFHALVELAGITRPVTVHSLRHTFAARLRERTGDLRVVQAALGHRQLGTTEVYVAVAGADVRRAVV